MSIETFLQIPSIFGDVATMDDIDERSLPEPEDMTDHDLWILATWPNVSCPTREEAIWELMSRAHRHGIRKFALRRPSWSDYEGTIFVSPPTL